MWDEHARKHHVNHGKRGVAQARLGPSSRSTRAWQTDMIGIFAAEAVRQRW